MKIPNLINSVLIAGVIAIISNVLIFFVSKSLGYLNKDILLPPGKPLTIFPVVVSSSVPALLAGVLLFVLGKFTNNPLKVFSIIAFAVIIASLIPPLFLKDIPLGTRITLLLMHITAGLIILFLIRKYSV